MSWPVSPTPLMALVMGMITTVAAALYGPWWLAVLLAVYTVLVGVSLVRRAHKIYKEGAWHPS